MMDVNELVSSFISYWFNETQRDERYLSQWMENQVNIGMVKSIDDYRIMRSMVDANIVSELSYHRLLCDKCNRKLGCTEDEVIGHLSSLDVQDVYSDFKRMNISDFIDKYNAFVEKLPLENEDYVFGGFQPHNFSVSEQKTAIFINAVGIIDMIPSIPTEILLISVARIMFETYKNRYMIGQYTFLDKINGALEYVKNEGHKRYCIKKSLLCEIKDLANIKNNNN